MYSLIVEMLLLFEMDEYSHWLAPGICVTAAGLACVFSRWLARVMVNRSVAKIQQRVNMPLLDAFITNHLFARLADLVVPFILYSVTADLSDKYPVIHKTSDILFIIIITRSLDACIRGVGMVYSARTAAKAVPMQSLLQVMNVAVFILGGMAIASVLLDRSPVMLLGSIGAVTALTSVVFKDAIVNFVAGIQLTGYDQIRIGDWIELPGQSANGTVTDISMTTVRVENFDKSITMVPAYTLVTCSFINWRGIFNTGARRIKRALLIDADGVKYCDDAMLLRLRKFTLLEKHIPPVSDEASGDNHKNSESGDALTNLGLFRFYILAYLQQHPSIRQDLMLLTRQMEQSASGIPLEIYAFANTAVWVEYEAIQSSILEHLYAVISEFDLRLFQYPSGSDAGFVVK